jgi:hypothetical protein
MYIDAPYFLYVMIDVYEKYNDRQSGAYNVACIKSTRVDHDVDQEPLTFCMWCCVCKKYKNRTGHRSGVPCFVYMVLHM